VLVEAGTSFLSALRVAVTGRGRGGCQGKTPVGLIVIGVHTPEYAYEKLIGNVRRAVQAMDISYPIAVDNNYAIWRAFNNQYWPAHYLIDAKGQVRFSHFGEGRYEDQEQVIRQLLEEARSASSS
jgi:hypothetical protein